MNSTKRMPTYFISHGGGPWPWMEGPMRDGMVEGILVIGSGLSYHNLRMFDARGIQPSRDFDAWLTEALTTKTAGERNKKLLAWEAAPSARQAHPREDHLLPLMVAVGAAENEIGVRGYHDENISGGITASSFRCGSPIA